MTILLPNLVLHYFFEFHIVLKRLICYPFYCYISVFPASCATKSRLPNCCPGCVDPVHGAVLMNSIGLKSPCCLLSRLRSNLFKTLCKPKPSHSKFEVGYRSSTWIEEMGIFITMNPWGYGPGR
ncbi:hypothetical protein FGIG_02112 [Fasciola gigantica]|uniref:Uncharacterized protein n=1 Tax=Fasciola gigantica TaxID=46835 RepID=A0A504YYH6_FASGI|nr:hypothetical protein FGIG_02112 [Fasciola gigantica]